MKRSLLLSLAVILYAFLGHTVASAQLNDQQMSTVGTAASNDAFNSAVAFNSTNNEYLIVWQADDADEGLLDEEFEIFGQRVNAATGAAIGAVIRISDAGGTGNIAYDAYEPDVAYNSSTNEYLVVWNADDIDMAGIVDEEFEIFGQRINAATGAEVGVNDFRISDAGGTGLGGPNTRFAKVTYNATANEYLVVWEADDTDAGIADEEYEIFGQRLDASGNEIGTNDFRISDSAGGDRDAFQAAVTHNSVNNTYLVVWQADDASMGLGNEEFEIFGQRLDASGNEIGTNDFRISDVGGTGNVLYQAWNPEVAYNPHQNDFFVVWNADDVDFGGIVDNEFEVYGRRINAVNGAIYPNTMRVSDAGGTGNTTSEAGHASIVYNINALEWLVTWHGVDQDVAGIAAGEDEVYGQRIIGWYDREIGENDFRISAAGGTGDAVRDAQHVWTAFNSTDNKYIVVWQSDDSGAGLGDNEFEIFAEEIPVSLLPTVSATDFTHTDRVTVTWSGLEAAAATVRIFRDGVDLGLVAAAVGTFDDNMGLSGVNYVYCLDVLDAGSGLLRQVCDRGIRFVGGPTDDQRLTSTDGPSPVFDADRARAAYNSTNNEYFVVWKADDPDFGLVDDEFEIFGQRVNAATGQPIGVPIRISDAGDTGNPAYAAYDPDVVYNVTTNEYLVVWYADDPDAVGLVDDEFEIFGQRLNAATGAEVGPNDFRISDAGGTGSNIAHARLAKVIYNATSNEYLVVWEADDSDAGLADDEFEIFGQRLDATGAEVGPNDFRISDSGGAGRGAFQAAVSHNSVDNTYLVVWQADDSDAGLADDEFEIFGQRLNANANQIGTNDFRISDVGGTGNSAYQAGLPEVAYNPHENDFFVVWQADDIDFAGIVDNETEIYGRRVNGADGFVYPLTMRISDSAGDGTTDSDVIEPTVIYNPNAFEWLVTWHGVDQGVTGIVVGENEIYGQRIIGWYDREIGENDFRISDAGGTGVGTVDAFHSATAFNSTNNEYLILWDADDSDAGLADGEHDIFMERRAVSVLPTVAATDSTFPHHVTVTWSGLEGAATHVKIYRDGAFISQVAAAAGTFDVSGGSLGIAQSYCVDVHDVNDVFLRQVCDNGSTWYGTVEEAGIVSVPTETIAFEFIEHNGANVAVRKTDAQPSNVTQIPGTVFNRYWEISRSGSGAFNTHVVFTLPANSLTVTDSQQPERILLYTRDDANATWARRDTAVVVDHTNQTVTFHNIRSYSHFAIARVNLLSNITFTASDDLFETLVQLNWGALPNEAALLRVTRDGQALTVLPTDVRVYEDNTGTPGVIYNYCLQILDSNQGVLETTCDDGTRRVKPPTSVTATDGSLDAHVLTTWADRSEINTGYNIYRSTGASVLLDGVDDGVTLTDFNPTSTFTAELWIRADATTNGQALVAKQTSGGDDIFVLGFYNGGLEVRLRDQVHRAGTLRTGWQHIAVVVRDQADNTSLVTVYRDGILIWSQVLNAVLGTPTGNAWTVGQRGSADFFGGHVDEVRFWNVARTLNQIRPTLYTALAGNESNLFALWDFEEGTGTTLGDKVGANNGTLSGGTWSYGVLPLGAATNVNASFHEDATAAAGITYVYCVAAKDANGVESIRRCNEGFRGFVLPPLNVTSSDGQYPTKVVVNWQDQATNETGYQIKRNGVVIGAVNPDSVKYEDTTGLVAGTTYTYCVVTTTATNNSVEACDTGGIGILPAVTNMAASDSTRDASVQITWDDPFGANTSYKPVDAATTRGFRVYITDIGGVAQTPPTLLATVGATETSYDHTTALAATSYRYCVRTLSTISSSDIESGDACDTGSRIPVLSAQDVTSTVNGLEDGIQVTWTVPATKSVLSKVYRSVGGETVLLKTTSRLIYVDNTAQSDVEYTYCVAPVEAGGIEAPFGISITGTCDTGSRRLSPASSVQATFDEGEDNVNITWTDNSEVESGYQVLRSTTALVFDGVDDRVENTTSGSEALAGDFSLALWMQGNTPNATLLSRHECGGNECTGGEGNNRFSLFTDAMGYLHFVVEDATNAAEQVTYSTSIHDGQWHHIVATRTQGDALRLFVDGVLVGKAKSTSGSLGNVDAEADPIVLGAAFSNSATASHHFQGKLDEVSVWTTALTEQQVRQYRYKAISGNEPGLLAAWRFEENTGTTTSDATTNNHDATITGATWTTDGALALILNTNGESAIDKQGIPGRTYTYGVIATDTWGQAELRTAIGRRTLRPPTELVAEDGVGEITVKLTWTDNSEVESGFRIFRQGPNDASPVQVGEVGQRISSFTDNPLPDDVGTVFTYSVAAFDAYGTSIVDTDAGSTALLAPADVQASEGYTDKVTLKWVDRSGIEGEYRILRDGAQIATVGANISTYTDNAAVVGVQYTYCVTAHRDGLTTAQVCDTGTRLATEIGTISFNEIKSNIGGEGGQIDDFFGYRTAVSRNRIIAGAWRRDTGQVDGGRLYWYNRNADGVFEREGSLDGVFLGGHFARDIDVSRDGNYLVVGEPAVGTLHFFEYRSGSYAGLKTFHDIFSHGENNALDHEGRFAVVGVTLSDNAGVTNTGDLRIFERTTNNDWVKQHTYVIPGAVENTRLGLGVSISGDGRVVVAGAHDATSGTGPFFSSGRSFVWVRNNPESAALTLQMQLEGTDLAIGDEFGLNSAISEDGEWIFVSAISKLHSGVAKAGKVYAYKRNGAYWGRDCFADPNENNLVTCFEDQSFISSTSPINEEQWGATVSVNQGRLVLGTRLGFYRTYALQGNQWVGTENMYVNRVPPAAVFNPFAGTIMDEFVALGAFGSSQGHVYLHEMLVPPGNVSASDGTDKNQVAITWNDNGANEESYVVYRNGEEIATVNANLESFSDFTAAPGITYEYCVASFSSDTRITLDESPRICDRGWRAPTGLISGNITASGGANVQDVNVCLNPSPNSALLFDGQGGGVEAPLHTLSSAANGVFTVEAWVNPAVTLPSGQHMPIFSLVEPRGRFNTIELRLHSNGAIPNDVEFRVSLDGTVRAVQGATPLQVGTWYHVAGVYDGSALTLYLNGQQLTTAPFSGTAATTGSPRLGTAVHATNTYFNGRIDDVRFWSAARTIPQISSLYNQPLTGTEQDLMAYWTANAGKGIGVADRTKKGVNGLLSGGVFWTNEGAPIGTCAKTDAEGNYTFADISFGQEQTFKVSPSKDVRQFEPKVKNISLNVDSPVQNEVNFTDVSSFTASGVVTYTGTVCPVDSVEVSLNGIFSAMTEADGKFAVTAELGDHQLSVQKGVGNGKHAFSPVTRSFAVAGDVTGINFTDDTKRVLRGRVQGGCNAAVGTAKLRVYTENGCFDQTYEVNGSYNLTLPAQRYLVQVTELTNVPSNLDKGDMLRFFGDLGVQEADLTQEGDTLDFIYRAPLTLSIEGLDARTDQSCTTGLTDVDGRLIPNVPLLAQGEPLDVQVRLSENYGSTICPIDSSDVLVFDEISGVAEADTVRIKDGLGQYRISPALPNIAAGRTVDGIDRSYQRSLTLITDVAGRDPLTQTHWAIIQGDQARTAEFVTMISDPVPLYVLRDPPGNTSYSYWGEGTSFCWGFNAMAVAGKTINFTVSREGGADGNLGIFAGLGTGVIKSQKQKITLDLESSVTVGAEVGLGGGFEFCFASDEVFSTSDSPSAIGADADVFLGVGLNFIFALADDLRVQQCSINVSESIVGGLDASEPFHTSFAYTRQHINGQLIPKLKQLTTLEQEGKVINETDRGVAINGIPLADQAGKWESMLARDSTWRAESEFVENRSFSSGASYEYAEVDTEVGTFEQTVSLYLSKSEKIGGTAKLPFLGTTRLENTFTTDLSFSFGFSQKWEDTETVGYVLSDSDLGDFFSVDIRKEKDARSHVFNLRSGVSSNPHEAGTQVRDKPRLAINPPIQQNLDPDETASYTLSLTNSSESKEEREYHIRPILSSNPGGAILRANGAPLFDHLSFVVGADRTQEITLEVDRGASRYLHENLQVQVVPPGDYALWEDGKTIVQADTVTFTASFAAPCTPVNLRRPIEFWRYTDPNGQPVDIIIDKFQRTWGDNQTVEKLGMEYRRLGTPTWSQAFSVNMADINPSFTTYSTTWIPPQEASYEVRAFSECNGGANRLYSYNVPGKRDTQPAVPFGTPEPADQVLASSEVVTIRFNESILCTSVDTDGANNNDTVELFYADGVESGTALTNINVVCDENALTIEPNGGWLAAHEGRLFRARVRNLLDEVDNPMANAVEWTFRVARSTFAWSPATLHATHTFGQNQTVSAELVNGSINNTSFSLPAQLTLTRTHDGAGQTLANGYTVDLVTRDGAGTALSTGSVVSNGKQEVRFTLPDTLSLGRYSGTISATTTLGAVPLHFSTEVVCQAPTWSVNPALFQYSMTVTAQLFVREGANYLASSDTNDIIGAFVEDELRGFARVQDLGGGLHRANLIVYSNVGGGERVTFRVYDSSSCNLFAETSKVFVFQSDVNHGTPNSPIVVQAPAPPAQNIAVAAGWTWISTNKVPTATDVTNVIKTLGGVAGTAGDIIKSQSSFSLYDSGTETWVGTLTTIHPGLGYQIKVAQSGELQLQGSNADLSTTINLQQGWNWIGYVPQAAQPINDALAGLSTVLQNDLIKSQFAFAQYVSGVGWLGSLTQLEPGYGYLMRVGSAGSFAYPTPPAEIQAVPLVRSVTEAHMLASLATLTEINAAHSAATAAYNNEATSRAAHTSIGTEDELGGKQLGHAEPKAADLLEEAVVSQAEYRAGWLLNPRIYSASMIVIATVPVEELALNAENVLVGAFVGDELRGVAPLEHMDALEEYRAFMMVYSDNAGEEDVRFRLFDRSSEEEFELGYATAFEADGVIGSVEDPIVLRMKQGLGNSELPETFALEANYPNPFNPETVIRYALPEASGVEIVVYDLLGREVFVLHKAHEQQAGRYEITFDGRDLASGVYVYRMKAGSFVSARRMILLK